MSRPGVTRKMSCTLAIGRRLKARSCTAKEEAALMGRGAVTTVVRSGEDSCTSWSGNAAKGAAGATGAGADERWNS